MKNMVFSHFWVSISSVFRKLTIQKCHNSIVPTKDPRSNPRYFCCFDDIANGLSCVQAKMTWGNSQIGDLTDCHCTWHWCEGYRQNMQAILVFQAYIGDWSLVVRFLVGSVAFLLGSDAIFEIDPPQFGSYLPLLLLAPKSWSCVGPAVSLGKKEGNSKVLFPSTSSACFLLSSQQNSRSAALFACWLIALPDWCHQECCWRKSLASKGNSAKKFRWPAS